MDTAQHTQHNSFRVTRRPWKALLVVSPTYTENSSRARRSRPLRLPDEYTRNPKSFLQSNFVRSPPLLSSSMLVNDRNSLSCASPIRIMFLRSMPTLFAALIARGSSAACVTKTLAPQPNKWIVNSSAVYAGLAGDTMPPAQCVPNVTVGVSIQFGENRATTSPFFHEKFVRRPAPKCLAVRFISAYV